MLSHARFLIAALISLLFASCEDNHLETFEEPITSMFYVLTPDSGRAVVLNFIDNDGVGGQPALVNSGTLLSNTTYRGQLTVGSRNPLTSARLSHLVDSSSVVAQPELHQVFFTPTNGVQLTVLYDDTDANGNPVGMQTILHTGEVSDGALGIAIIHHPNKAATGVSNGNRTRAGGSIDAEALFEIAVMATALP